jgi:hypothetical protein
VTDIKTPKLLWARESIMKSWLKRLPVVFLVAAFMGFVGLQVLNWAAVTFAGFERGGTMQMDWGTIWVICASVLLWGCLTLLLQNQSLSKWALCGMASPLLGCLLVAPPLSFTMFLYGYGFLAFPIGLVTGVLMWGINRT